MKHDFRYFFREGIRNMFSHGFMSFAAIGVTVACLVIMGTFSLVAYNANENLKDLQKENAVLAFVDENLSDNEAKALQSTLEKIPGGRTAPSSPGRRHGIATWSSTMRTTCTATWIPPFFAIGTLSI